ncbi:MAG: HAMP domain-containing sensor histidine kinase [Sediminibacterium sp.]|nr:HAMP domain-containing sensor histidine kinase [Sediminibacterium sp.]
MSEKTEYTRLLKRQINKYLAETEQTPALKSFLDAVNNSYLYYEEDMRLTHRATQISSEELYRINQQLKESNEFLDTFNHGLAHDLKNHATNVSSMIHMLKKYFNSGDQTKLQQILERLEDSSNHFLTIIQGFQYISNTENSLNNGREEFYAKELQEEIFKESSFIIEKYNPELNFNFELNKIVFSKHQIKTIINNLVSNGIKYSKPDVRPVISIYLTETESVYKIVIQDNGLGMDLKRNEKKLYQLFSRLNNKKDTEGTGLGLYLVKRLVDRNKGTIQLESELGVGTTFTITLSKF